MTSTVNNGKTAALIALALAIAGVGIYVAYADDPSLTGLGPAGVGLLLMAVGVVLGVRAARNRLPTWAPRTLLAVGVLTAGVAALLIHGVAVAAPLFPQRNVPSAVDSAPSPQYAAAVERARELARAAVLEQNLPGVSVAVGVGPPSGLSAVALAESLAKRPRLSGRKDSAGGMSTRRHPSRRRPDSTSARLRPWSLPQLLRRSA